MRVIPGEYDTVIILGNGFDLNLGLKTSYADFIQSKFFTDLLDSNYLCQELKGQQTPENWIDIEKLLKAISKYSPNNIKADFRALVSALTEYIKTIDYSKVNAKSKAWEFLGSLANKKFVILDFNYTRTTYHLLKHFRISDNDIADKLFKVHGSAEYNDIIFGVEDNAEINLRDIFLRKSVNDNFNSFNLKTVTAGNRELHIFGHSLGETDHSYFQAFFDHHTNNLENKKIVLHGYGEEGCHDLYRQLDKLTRFNIGMMKRNNIFQMIDCTK